MKKSSIWKLLFSALTVFAVAVFAGCTDDNDDMGAPYLNVTPENLTFDAEGQPADEYNGTFIVETNRPWRAIVEDEQTWVRLSATEGEGDAAVTVTVPASNIGQSAKVTFEVYNSYGALIQKDVNVLQGEVKPATVIYGNNFDKTLAAKDANNRWPFLDQSDAWQNATGTGIESVTYAYKNMSVRSSQKNSGGYDGASGQNKIFFGTAPANFDIDNITLPSGETNYRITFGANYSKNNDGTYDNTFKPEYFHVWVGNGTTWKELKYEKIGGSDETDPYWILFKSDFTLKTALNELSIRFTTTTGGEAANSAFSIDDLSFTNGNGGQEVDLEGGVVPPDPGEATAITIPELIAQMTTTEAPVDANADRYLDAVVMNDVAGANYTFNNLILATENATEAGNGITLCGSQVEPSTLGLNKGDKVRVTLYKGLAKVVNSGMYEVTGAKEATWCKVEKTGTVTSIPTATIAAADLAKYQGMAVTIANASVAQAGVWASASALSSHTFTADGANFTVFCKQSDEKNPSVFLDVPFKAGSGNISGLAAVYKNNSQLVPRNLDDVAAFSDSSTPMITWVTPASVSIPAIGGNETIIVSVANKGENVLSVSGLSGLLEATVDNANNMVTVTAQPNTGAVQNQTLTIAIAGGNSVTVPVTLLGVGGGGTGEVVAFSITDIKADNADLPTNGYGSQVVATPSTWVSWTVGGIEFTGVKICESPASNGSIIQMQGNDSDAAKQAKLQNVTPIDGMSKIKIVFRSYPNESGSYYNPGYTMTVAGAAQTPVETYTDKSGYREYVHEYDLAGLGADSFVLYNNKVGALYIESFEITK